MDVIINGTKFVPEPDRTVTAPTLAVLLLRAESLRHAAPGFSCQSCINSYAALAKLDCGSAPLAMALLEPLLRCLGSPADRPVPFALANLMYVSLAGGGGWSRRVQASREHSYAHILVAPQAFAKDFASCKQAFLTAKPWLFALMWEQCALYDGQVGSLFFTIAAATLRIPSRP